ncbi:hypothetical protein [Hydrogenophaga sp. ANAO-22]|uniref:hypothetical protein n=1 Tax=Hydrogenophaga sp. ANAO-22 TaxID=3166645 RepID=UPI0036D30B81
MTLKELAHAAQQTLQDHTGRAIKRSHVHELLAAAFGYRSWAALLSESLLADSGIGILPSGTQAKVVGRALQLQYDQRLAEAIARDILQFTEEHQLSYISWSDVSDVLMPKIRASHHDDSDEEDDGERTDESAPAANLTSYTADQLKRSPMLLHSLELAAESSKPQADFLLAALYRCKCPNPYLYEESRRGRVLNAVERGWVEEYLRLEPEYRKYEAHLKAAALGGVRAAALEYGTVFQNSEFHELAERLTGAVDALQMSRVAATPKARAQWLHTAAEQGSRSALEELANRGDAWAEEQVAQWESDYWLRSAAERALSAGDAQRAWTWQYLALERGLDLTLSTLAARHDGGQLDGKRAAIPPLKGSV